MAQNYFKNLTNLRKRFCESPPCFLKLVHVNKNRFPSLYLRNQKYKVTYNDSLYQKIYRIEKKHILD